MATYVTSDLHGMYDLYLKIKEILKPEDTLYYLGDACDRGPRGWELIKSLLANPQVVYLKGNHEDMLIKVYNDYAKYAPLHIANGGKATLCDCFADPIAEKVITELSLLPLVAEYTNKNHQTFLMSHAGFTPPMTPQTDYIWDRTHFYEDWSKDIDSIIIHGHTPIYHLAGKLDIDVPNGSLHYCNGHKICVDCWSCATKAAILFNLDTLEDYIVTI